MSHFDQFGLNYCQAMAIEDVSFNPLVAYGINKYK